MKEDKNIIEDDNYDMLNHIISALKKPIDKRYEREIELIVPLLKEIDFFKNKN